MVIIYQKRTLLYFSIALLFLFSFIFHLISAFILSPFLIIFAFLSLIFSIGIINITLPIVLTKKLLYVPRSLLLRKLPIFDYYDIFEIKNVKYIQEKDDIIVIEIVNGVKRTFNKNINKTNLKRFNQYINKYNLSKSFVVK